MSVRRRLQCRVEIFPVRSFHPVHQPVPDHFAFLITCFIAAPVRITDQSRRIQHQDHALRRIQDLLIEVPFPLQLRLKRLLFRNIQHQPANLRDSPASVAHCGDVLQRVQQRSIFASQRFLVITQHASFRKRLQKLVTRFRHRIQMRTYVRAQQFLPRRIPQHAHHRIIYVQESPVRRREKQSFLDAVKQLAIPPFRLPPVGNVLQYMDRARIVIRHAWRSRSRNKKNTLRRRRHVLFLRAVGIAAERAWQIASCFRNLPQAAHGFADQRYGRHAKVRRERPVRSNDIPRPVVDHDVVADRIDVFHPLPFRTLQLRESPEIFQ